MIQIGTSIRRLRARSAWPLAVLAAVAGPASALAAESAPPATKCEYGITLALGGDLAASESVFVSLLSDRPGDAAAFNNLGNLSVLRGDLDLALVFYDKSMASDSSDAGVLYNRATTLMLTGDEEAARQEAAHAIRKAGGVQELNAIAGIGVQDSEEAAPDKASDAAYLGKQEVRDLLKGAMVPLKPKPTDAVSDSTAARTPPPADGPKKRPRLWNSAAPRASEAGQGAMVLYWKH